MPQAPISAHPLEPLTRAEIERVVALVRADPALGIPVAPGSRPMSQAIVR